MQKHYGEFVASTHPLPAWTADHILGVRLSVDSRGRPEWIDVQIQTADGEPFREVRMDFVGAMFLLSCLKSIQLDAGIPFPDDPRG